MEKIKLSFYFQDGFQSEIKTEDLETLRRDVLNSSQKSKDKNIIEYASELESNFPEVSILHDYYMRIKFNKIESSLRIIKNIMQLMVILTIIGSLILIFSII